MSDLVERLRKPIGACLVDGTHFKKGDPIHDTLRIEAADEITALRAEVERLRAALGTIRDHGMSSPRTFSVQTAIDALGPRGAP